MENNPSIVGELKYDYGSEKVSSPLDLIAHSRNGVSMSIVLELAENLDLSLQEVANILHVSLRTLQRYTPEKVLDTDSSAKILQLSRLRTHGLQVFENDKALAKWLKSNLVILNRQQPLEILDTPYGFTLVDQLLGRIEHGIFS
jgi:putative toxin-antitoxin system antitoxin component (TIGR02293 family)